MNGWTSVADGRGHFDVERRSSAWAAMKGPLGGGLRGVAGLREPVSPLLLALGVGRGADRLVRLQAGTETTTDSRG